ncbi:MAG TPA: glycosyl hydrolase family 18 protein, partial [Acidimicrobiales bacterium]
MNRPQRLLRWGAAIVGSARASVRQSGRRQRLIAAAVASIVAIAAVAGIVVFAASSDGAPDQAAGSSAYEHSGKAGNADLSMLGGHHRAKLAPATSSPAPAPASVATAAPLASHEVFGFAPYWTLDQSTTYDVAGSTTIAYFAVGINPDGTLDESGSGWNGYESQDLVNLIDRAHAAGVRVVLTVNDFDQQSLDQLTSSPTAPTTLAQALIGAVEAKDLDGVNLDLEGDGSADQAGLTNLVGQVSTALHQVNPHWQVTMDTYASSAGDPNGFYDVPALANVVDGFFVMQYSPNLSGSAQATSPLTSSLFNDVTTAGQYAAAVPASKVILGAPLFGLDWPTNGDTLTAAATGPVTDLAYSQIATAGHPTYWDPVTDSAWTAYQVGTQWHESFFDDPTSLYDVSQLAHLFGLGGVGVWALGMDGSADTAMLTALGGTAPSITYAPSPGTP